MDEIAGVELGGRGAGTEMQDGLECPERIILQSMQKLISFEVITKAERGQTSPLLGVPQTIDHNNIVKSSLIQSRDDGAPVNPAPPPRDEHAAIV